MYANVHWSTCGPLFSSRWPTSYPHGFPFAAANGLSIRLIRIWPSCVTSPVTVRWSNDSRSSFVSSTRLFDARLSLEYSTRWEPAVLSNDSSFKLNETLLEPRISSDSRTFFVPPRFIFRGLNVIMSNLLHARVETPSSGLGRSKLPNEQHCPVLIAFYCFVSWKMDRYSVIRLTNTKRHNELATVNGVCPNEQLPFSKYPVTVDRSIEWIVRKRDGVA